jgi:hypothetical protein
LYFGWKGAMRKLDLETLEERVVWEPSPPMRARKMRLRGRANPTTGAQSARKQLRVRDVGRGAAAMRALDDSS